jgi:hypothetical protein
VPDIAAAPNDGTGWMVGRGAVTTVGVPSQPYLARNHYILGDINADLKARTSGVGSGAIIGLEMKICKLRLALEADCSTLNYGKNNDRDSPFQDFSFGVSYRVALKLGNYLTPYLLAGLEFNRLRGKQDNPHFRESGKSVFDPNNEWVARADSSSDRLFYSLEEGRMIQSPRLGCGLEIVFFERFKFRFDVLWTLRRKFSSRFRTETVDNALQAAFIVINPAEADMTFRRYKFSTRFGVILDL